MTSITARAAAEGDLPRIIALVTGMFEELGTPVLGTGWQEAATARLRFDPDAAAFVAIAADGSTADGYTADGSSVDGAASVCSASACAASARSASVCSASACAASARSASVCAASVCAASVCAGSVCAASARSPSARSPSARSPSARTPSARSADRDGRPSDLPIAVAVGIIDRRLPSPRRPTGRVGYLEWLATDPRHRRRGAARAALEELLRWFDDRGVPVVDVHASAAARPLYDTLGFRPPHAAALRRNAPE